HFTIHHKKFASEYPPKSNLRKVKVRELKTALASQQSVLRNMLVSVKENILAVVPLAGKTRVDESIDVCDMAQLCIFLRAVFEDCSVKENILAVVPLAGKTRGEDIYLVVKHSLQEIDAPLQKLVSITTDGAPAMLGSASLLCAKTTLTFLIFLTFLEERNEHYQELSDQLWLTDLAFLTDLTSKLNTVNLELQGKDTTLTQLIGSVNAFRRKLRLWSAQIKKGVFTHFPGLAKKQEEHASFDKDIYAEQIEKI
ncbi:GT2D2 protein, partial [Polyodon spathula]|nr:GT2D2 protein [Polyodon spathula]